MATATLERPTAHPATEDGEFIVYHDIPVWKEHVNTRDFKQPERFTRRDIERVCAHCNERISETRDFPAIVIRHNSDETDEDRPVVGFAGPFYVGTLGAKKPVATIFARDWYIYKDRADVMKRYPRRSVEYWFESDDPKGGYFDPISLLGSETPELDLGVVYSKPATSASGYTRACYSATIPGGSNTFLPGEITANKKKTPFSKEFSDMALTPEDIQQIVQAFEPIMDAKISALGITPPADDLGDGLGEEIPPEDLDGAGLDGEQESHYAKACKYMAADDSDGLSSHLQSLGDKDKASFQADMDADEDEERREKIKFAMGGGQAAPAQYRKQLDRERATSAKYRKERDEYKAKYQRASTRLAEVEAELTPLREETMRTARYSKLREKLDEGYVFEIEDEIELVSDLDDSQFDRHIERVVAKYQRAPINGQLHIPKPEKIVTKPADGANAADQAQRATYAKKAVELVSSEREKGVEVPYERALEMVMQTNGVAK